MGSAHETVVRAIEDLGIWTAVTVDGTRVWVEVDRERIEQVLGELIDNALKHSDDPAVCRSVSSPSPTAR